MGFVNVRTAALDDPGAFPPFIESYRSEALPWATTSAKYSYEAFPDVAEYPKLIAEYAAASS